MARYIGNRTGLEWQKICRIELVRMLKEMEIDVHQCDIVVMWDEHRHVDILHINTTASIGTNCRISQTYRLPVEGHLQILGVLKEVVDKVAEKAWEQVQLV